MKTALLTLALALSGGTSPAQERTPSTEATVSRQDPESAKTVEGLVQALYASVSFGPGGEPDWDSLRGLLMEDAVFVQPVRRGKKAEAIDTDAFFALFRRDLVEQRLAETGFHESVANLRSMRFGNLVHCWVVFEVRREPKAERPLARGVDSIQLVFDQGRFWVASITTDFERPGKPIPEELLKGGQER